MLSAPEQFTRMPTRFTIYEVPEEKIPPPPAKRIEQPPPDSRTTVTTPPEVVINLAPIHPLTFSPPIDIGTGPTTVIPPVAAKIVDAVVDPRFAHQFQPDYPSQLARENIEGVVKVRVLVGIDGRVKAIEMLSATDPLFFDTTERKAMRSWRFRPATRDGVPMETWQVMAVRFRMES